MPHLNRSSGLSFKLLGVPHSELPSLALPLSSWHPVGVPLSQLAPSGVGGFFPGSFHGLSSASSTYSWGVMDIFFSNLAPRPASLHSSFSRRCAEVHKMGTHPPRLPTEACCPCQMLKAHGLLNKNPRVRNKRIELGRWYIWGRCRGRRLVLPLSWCAVSLVQAPAQCLVHYMDQSWRQSGIPQTEGAWGQGPALALLAAHEPGCLAKSCHMPTSHWAASQLTAVDFIWKRTRGSWMGVAHIEWPI